MELYGFQEKAINELLLSNRKILLAPCGSGKTIMIIEIINRLYRDQYKILVISPKNVLNTVFLDHVCHLNKNITYSFYSEHASVCFFNRESLHKVKGKYDCILVDESSMFKTPTGKATRLLKKLIGDSTRVYLMTGTFYGNNLVSVYAQISLINQSIYGSLQDFTNKHREISNVLPSGHRIYKDKPNAHLKIKKNISDYIVEIAPEDIFIPCYKVYKIHYTPPEAFYDFYEKIGDSEYLTLYNNNDPMEAGVIMFKKHQFISGGFYNKEKEFVRIHYYRLKVVCAIFKKIKNENCIVFYNFLFEKELLLKTPFKNDIECYDPGKDPEKNILLLPIKSCSHGLNLQQYKNVMFFSLTHSSESFIQAVSRVVRNGQENDVKIFIPLCTHTLDIKIYNRIKKANSIAVKEFNSVLKLFD